MVEKNCNFLSILNLLDKSIKGSAKYKKLSENKYLKNYSSKIKDIIIELHNYSFYHRPNDASNPDRRFIGRENVIEKLKTILTNSEVKSGTYLLTGFRGMGKTSLVNKVLEELNSVKSPYPLFSRFMRIIFAALFFSLFDVLKAFNDLPSLGINCIFLIYIPFSILAASFYYIYSQNIERISIRNSANKKILQNLLQTSLFIFDFSRKTRGTSRILLLLSQDYILASIIHISAVTFMAYEVNLAYEISHQYATKFIVYFSFIILYFSLLIIYHKAFKLFDIEKHKLQDNKVKYEIDKEKYKNDKEKYKSKTNSNKATLDIAETAILNEKINLIDEKINTANNEINLIEEVINVTKIKINFIDYKFSKISKRKVILSTIIISIPIALLCISDIKALFRISILLTFIATIIFNYKLILVNFSKFANNGHIVSIRINLGQEKLKEKDILRLIAKTTYEEYKKILRPFHYGRRILWSIFSFGIIYLLFLTLYYYRPTYAIIDEIRTELAIKKRFPSQAIFGKSDTKLDFDLDKKIVNEIESFEKINGKISYKDYINIINNNRTDDLRVIFDTTEIAIDCENIQEKLFEDIDTQKRNSPLINFFIHENYDELIESTLEITVPQPQSRHLFCFKNIIDTIDTYFFNKTILIDETYANEIIILHNEIEKYNESFNSYMLSKVLNGYLESRNFLASTTENSIRVNKDSIIVSDFVSLIPPKKLKFELSIFDNDTSWIKEFIKLNYNECTNSLASYISEINKIDTSFYGSDNKTNVNKINFNRMLVRLDYFIYILYSDVSHFIFDARSIINKKILGNNIKKNSNSVNSIFNKTLDLHPNFHSIPLRLDYLFILFFLIFYLFCAILTRLGFLGTTHKKVIRELKDLIDNIDSSVSINDSKSAGTKSTYIPFYFGRGKRKNYPLATEREIETKLIHILALCERISSIRMRPNLVFIFDELDKIEPTGTFSEDNTQSIDSYVTEGTRKRQETIGRILSNLKHFFNTAKAKFIFIAGREMYDASIADISDRDSLIGSLFHEVIYVNSFFKDPTDQKLSDINSMTERYVCQFLVPNNYGEKGDKNLKIFYQYLKDHDKDKDLGSKNYRREIAKIIFTLQSFITYLTYRSNGSPKKITKIFEEYVISGNSKKSQDRTNIVKIGKSNKNLYLHLNEYAQYTFGFSSFLFNPFVNYINKHLRDYGDKLLVSTTFLLNHVYKFHGTGFSYRTLELTPEIIAVNKAPELREFIDSLLKFSSRIHIREIQSGLHEFKFNSIIESEIKFISKISEKESAAHNFTLDESEEIKGLYKSKLSELREDFNASKHDIKEYNIEASYLNFILGDLYYHDQEYENALLLYKRALAPYRNIELDNFKLDSLVFYIRVQLKLGLTHEKKRNYDDALLIYENLKLKVLTFSKLLFTFYKIKTVKDFNIQKNIKKKDSNEPDYIKFSKKFVNENLKSDKLGSEMLFALKLIYQPFIAELQLIEKHTLKSLTKNFILESENQFRNVVNILSPEQSYLLAAEHYNKTGDVLFYKNGYLFGDKNTISEKEKIDIQKFDDLLKKKRVSDKMRYYNFPISAFKYYLHSLSVACEVAIKEDFNITRKPANFNEGILKLPISLLHDCTNFLFKATENKLPISRKSIFTTIGNSLSDVGDCILCLVKENKDRHIKLSNLKILLDLRLDKYYKHFNRNTLRITGSKKLSYIEIGIRFIYIAANFYLKAGEYKEYSFQLTKILHLIKANYKFIDENYNINKEKFIIHKKKYDAFEVKYETYKKSAISLKRKYNIFETNNNLRKNKYDLHKREYASHQRDYDAHKQKYLNSLNQLIVRKAIRNTYRAYQNNNEVEIEHLKEIFQDDKSNYEKLIRTNTSASEDIKEILIIYKELELHWGLTDLKKIEDCFVHPYSTINRRHNRMYELYYKVKFNYKVFLDILVITEEDPDEIFEKCKTEYKNCHDDKKLEKLDYLIVDSISCFRELIKTIELYKVSYIHSHRHLASIYDRLASWITLFESSKNSDLKSQLASQIGEVEANDLNINSAYEHAIAHYYRTIELHSEGDAYSTITQNMYSLDDNYNDNLFHFSATLDRIEINLGLIEKRIVILERKTKGRNEYKVDTYFEK